MSARAAAALEQLSGAGAPPSALPGRDRSHVDRERDEAMVRRAVAARLGLRPDDLDARRPLALYGLDSVTSAEVVAAIERATGHALPEWILHDHPTIDGVCDYLRELRTPEGAPDRPSEGALERASERASARAPDARAATPFDEDAHLPPGIQPAYCAADTMSHVLLTGGTGFLGAWVLRELLGRGTRRVSCLVRAPTSDAGALRIRDTLARYGVRIDDLATRVDVVCGDLAAPGLGLDVVVRRTLAGSVDAVVHAGADVDWVRPYAALRDVNVLGTREIVRFCAEGRPKTLRFVSSQLVCLAPDARLDVAEDDDVSADAGRLPLGYAQSKSVAERIVRAAAARGLRTSIIRPSLIMGDAATGVSHADDFVGSLVRGCLAMGAAPDLDWTIDAVPVDHVARSVVGLPVAGIGGAECRHLVNPRARHWRECVLWMNLYGYDCALVPYSDWRERLAHESADAAHPLHRLRPFFLRPTALGVTTPELYEDGRRPRVRDGSTRAALDAAGLECPGLTADLLHRYFDEYVRRGVIPRPPHGRPARRAGGQWMAGGTAGRAGRAGRSDRIGSRRAWVGGRVPPVGARVTAGSEHSILGELTSWRHGRDTGLFRHRVEGHATSTVVVKVKPRDEDVIDVGRTIARLCSPQLGSAFSAAADLLAVRGAHHRELAIYETAPPAARSLMPECFGLWRDDEARDWGLVLEDVGEAGLVDATDDPSVWTRPALDAAIDGLAAIHAAWAPRVDSLRDAAWMTRPWSAEAAGRLMPLWHALSEHAAPFHRVWAGDAAPGLHARLVATVPAWWRERDAAAVQTLIHNDCNPRNVAMRRLDDGYRLCAYDWELATIGAPQRDLAEWLCFVLPERATREEVDRLSDRHRRALASHLGREIPHAGWRIGLRAAMAEVLVDRLAFYTMIQRVRPQAFLPRVVRVWHRLYAHLEGS